MNQKYNLFFDNIIKIKIKGKNIDNFVRRMNSVNIDILEINYLNYKEAYLKIKKQDYEKVTNLKTIYEIELVEIYGFDRLKYNIKKNRYIIISLLIGIIIIYTLSHMIFDIEVVHNDKNLRQIITEELKLKGIKKNSFKKSYKQIQDIKKMILEKYKDKIEWLEIENIGTKYIVRLEERVITKDDNINTPQNVVAKKDALIVDIDASSGEIVKNINDYVKKGDIIITGDIKLNEETKQSIRAEGKVYGEIWYKVNVEYPLYYYEEKEIGKNKTRLVINFLNNKIKLFDNRQTKTTKEKTLFKNSLLPIKITINKEKKIEIINEKYSENQAVEKGIEKAYKKIQLRLKDDEKIVSHKIIKKEIKDNSVILELFVVVYENITDYSEIIINQENDINQENN